MQFDRQWHEDHIAQYEQVIEQEFKDRHRTGLAKAKRIIVYWAAGLRFLREELKAMPE